MSEGDKPKPKAKRRRREPMPEAWKKHANGPARRKHDKRYPAPAVEVVATDEGWTFESPFRSADEAEWWRLLGEAFGTRVKGVIAVFLGQVARLIETDWDEATGTQVPNEAELQAALAIVAAMKPRNEAEAAQAAQAFALHLAAMKTGSGIARTTYVDPRQANALANLTKAYTGVMDSLKRDRRRANTSKQTIVVEKNVRVTNDNRQVHLHPGGGRTAADQPHDAEETTRTRPQHDASPEGRTGVIEGRPALPSPPEVWDGVQIPGDEGPDGLREARGEVSGSA